MGFKLQAFMSLGLDAVRSFQVARAELNNAGAGLSPFASPLKGKPAGAPIDNAAERINQNLLRMLCSVAAVGGAGTGDDGTGTGVNDALPALDALERIIFGVGTNDDDDDTGAGGSAGGGGDTTRGTASQAKAKMPPREHAKPLVSHGSAAWSDMIYAVVSLSHALRSTSRPRTDPWCQKALALLNRLLDEVHEVVGDKLGQVRLEAMASQGQGQFDDKGGGDSGGAGSAPCGLNDVCLAVCEVVSRRFGQCVQGMCDTAVLDAWDRFVISEMADAADKEQAQWCLAQEEDRITPVKLTSFAKLRSSSLDASVTSAWSFADALEVAQGRFNSTATECKLAHELVLKPLASRFRFMLAELVNERGPWSREGSHHDEVFWVSTSTFAPVSPCHAVIASFSNPPFLDP